MLYKRQQETLYAKVLFTFISKFEKLEQESFIKRFSRRPFVVLCTCLITFNEHVHKLFHTNVLVISYNCHLETFITNFRKKIVQRNFLRSFIKNVKQK